MYRLLDLYCCAGGAAKGYMNAGFYVVGVDIKHQKRYIGNEFYQDDALTFAAAHGHEFDAIHASPPCQLYSEMTPIHSKLNHPDLIAPTRFWLQAVGKPYVIENVEMAAKHLRTPIKLCGTMFGLPIWRHRYFEISHIPFFLTAPCQHIEYPIIVSGRGSRKVNGKRKADDSIADKRKAMEMDWVTDSEITEAIPPAYTEFIGNKLIDYLDNQAKVKSSNFDVFASIRV